MKKRITINIPETKIPFFIELIKELGFEVAEEEEIPEEHKTIVRERIRSAEQENMIPWKEARKRFTFKGKS